jgi:hypothetical protein
MRDGPRIISVGDDGSDYVPNSLRSGETRFAVLLDTLCSSESEADLQKRSSFGLVLTSLVCAGAMAVAGVHFSYPVLLICGIALAGSLGAWMIYAGISARNSVRQYRELFAVAREELSALAEQVSEYLRNLDARTSRYFHCVTTTKITTYFMLRQIETGLVDVVDQLNRACRKTSRTEALSALKMLRQPFYYRDGFACNSGQIYQVLLRDLPMRVVYLMDSLELNIRELERELASWQGAAVDPKTLE